VGVEIRCESETPTNKRDGCGVGCYVPCTAPPNREQMMTKYPEHQQVVDAANRIRSKISVVAREAYERMLAKHENETNE